MTVHLVCSREPSQSQCRIVDMLWTQRWHNSYTRYQLTKSRRASLENPKCWHSWSSRNTQPNATFSGQLARSGWRALGTFAFEVGRASLNILLKLGLILTTPCFSVARNMRFRGSETFPPPETGGRKPEIDIRDSCSTRVVGPALQACRLDESVVSPLDESTK